MNKYIIHVCGPNGAGKSTFTKMALIRLDLPVINPDRFSTQGLSDIAAGRLAIRLTNEYMKAGLSFIRESTQSTKYDIRLMRKAKEAGYLNILIFLSLSSVNLSIQRVLRRASNGGHMIPEDTVRRRFPRSAANLAIASGIADRLFIIDNSSLNYDMRDVDTLLTNDRDQADSRKKSWFAPGTWFNSKTGI